MKRKLSILCSLFLAVGLAAAAGPATSSGSGKVLDRDGNPVKGVELTFYPESNQHLRYTGKTNKKGRYFVDGMYTPKEGEVWLVEVKAEGYLPTAFKYVSRNAQRTLIEDLEKAMKPGRPLKFPTMNIRPFGSVQLDVTLGPEAEVLAEQSGGATAPDVPALAVPKPAEATGDATATAKKEDPWNKALTLAGNGDYEASLPEFAKSLADAPDDPERYSTYAKILMQVGRAGDALGPAIKAAELAPEDVEARVLLSVVHAKGGSLDQARTEIDKARELAPDDRRVLEQLAKVAQESEDTPTAIEAYESLTAADGTRVEHWISLGNLYSKSGDSAKSEAAYQKVVELDPENAYQTFYNIGVLIMNRTGQSKAEWQRAIEAFRQAVKIKPDYGPAHKQLGFALLNVGDRKGSAEALRGYLKSQPKAPDRKDIEQMISMLQAG